MTPQNVSLTTAEWSVMECLWEKSPITGREATDWLEKRMGWNRSTT
ncbi:MAG TPA: transcriptional regulator, partial [Clostridiales bacterium]|nr:transcriptional regulator [Clostridiales bacterium]